MFLASPISFIHLANIYKYAKTWAEARTDPIIVAHWSGSTSTSIHAAPYISPLRKAMHYLGCCHVLTVDPLVNMESLARPGQLTPSKATGLSINQRNKWGSPVPISNLLKARASIGRKVRVCISIQLVKRTLPIRGRESSIGYWKRLLVTGTPVTWSFHQGSHEFYSQQRWLIRTMLFLV